MTTTCLLWMLITPLIVLLGVALWLAESQPQKIKRWHRQGQSQTAISKRLGVSRYRVRRALAAV